VALNSLQRVSRKCFVVALVVKLRVAQLVKKSLPFMEPKRSLPCSQNPESEESTPRPHTIYFSPLKRIVEVNVDFATDGQAAILSWCRAPFRTHDQILNLLLSDNYLLLHVGHSL
jgi:hypothetical protein